MPPKRESKLGASPTIKDEISSLTSVRGLAACWVVLLHFSDALYGLLPEASFLNPFISAGHFAVPLFFVLSGYVLGFSYLAKLSHPTARSVIRFWWLRLGRIYPVHICTLAVSWLLVARNGWPKDDGHSLGSFIANCFLVHAWGHDFRLSWNYPSWSISSEWFAYLCFPAIAHMLSRANRKSAVILVMSACLIAACVYAFEQHLVFKGLMMVMPTFVGGVGLAIVFPPGSSKIPPRAAELGILGAIALPFVVEPSPLLNSLYVLLFFLLVAILGGVGNRSDRIWRCRPLVFLGEISYSLYMTHAITITLLAKYTPFFEGQERPLAFRIAALLCSLFTIFAAAAAMYRVIEQPLRAASRRLVAA